MIEALTVVAMALWIGVKCIVFAIAALGLLMIWIQNKQP